MNEWAVQAVCLQAPSARARADPTPSTLARRWAARVHTASATRRRSSLTAAAAAAATATAGCRLPAAGCRLPAAGCCRLTADGCGERRRLDWRSLREGATEPAALDLGATRRQFERRSARPLRVRRMIEHAGRRIVYYRPTPRRGAVVLAGARGASVLERAQHCGRSGRLAQRPQTHTHTHTHIAHIPTLTTTP